MVVINVNKILCILKCVYSIFQQQIIELQMHYSHCQSSVNLRYYEMQTEFLSFQDLFCIGIPSKFEFQVCKTVRMLFQLIVQHIYDLLCISIQLKNDAEKFNIGIGLLVNLYSNVKKIIRCLNIDYICQVSYCLSEMVSDGIFYIEVQVKVRDNSISMAFVIMYIMFSSQIVHSIDEMNTCVHILVIGQT